MCNGQRSLQTDGPLPLNRELYVWKFPCARIPRQGILSLKFLGRRLHLHLLPPHLCPMLL